MSLEHELALALQVGHGAARLIAAIYQTDFRIDWKAAGDPVTRADRQANALIVDAIRSTFPDDTICAEESDTEQSQVAAARGGRTWFVDPLDGTREFVNRTNEFCVMIGLAIDGKPVLGVVIEPISERVFCGIVGQGAWEQQASERRPLVPSNETEPTRASLTVSRSHFHHETKVLADRLGIPTLVPCGSTGLKIVRVAMGGADGYVHTGSGPKLWDGCAPEAIARAAGLDITDADGRTISYQTSHLGLDAGMVVANPVLAAKLRAGLQL